MPIRQSKKMISLFKSIIDLFLPTKDLVCDIFAATMTLGLAAGTSRIWSLLFEVDTTFFRIALRKRTLV